MVGCKDKVESIALKDGVIKTEYYVGETFDATSGTLVAKIGSKYVDVALTDSEVEIVNFSTDDVVSSATAKIVYKGNSTEFNYSVALKPMLDFELSGGTYVYDKQVHDVEIGEVVEGANITKTYANAGLYGTEFSGAVNAGTYVINVTVSKEGYDSVTKTAEIIITPIEVIATIEGGDYVYSGDVYEVVTRVQGVLDGDDVKVAIGGTDKARNAGTYYAYCTGVGGTSAINYVLNTELSPSSENPFEWTIAKATAVGIDNNTVEFVDQVVDYDGGIKTITAAAKQLILNEGQSTQEIPLTETYEYFDEFNTSLGFNGVVEAGSYTVSLTYKFTNFNDIVLTATLTVKAEPVEWKLKTEYANDLAEVIVVTSTGNGIYELNNETILDIYYLTLEFDGTNNTAKLYSSDNFDEDELIDFSVVTVDKDGYITEISINGVNYYA